MDIPTTHAYPKPICYQLVIEVASVARRMMGLNGVPVIPTAAIKMPVTDTVKSVIIKYIL